jgi:uncharacterized SAM-binding protein YcdF (DUF218 family)
MSLLAGLVLPPSSLFLLIALGLLGRKRRWGPWASTVGLLGLVLFSMPYSAMLAARPFEAAYPPFDAKRFSSVAGTRYAVIVLGGGRDFGAAEYPEGERMSNSTLQRVRYGARLARTLSLPLAVSGGLPLGGRHSEADLMNRFVAEELGQEVLLVEARSQDTRDNALFTSEALRRLGFGGALLVTDVAHMPRALRAFAPHGLDIVPAPIRYSADRPTSMKDFIPSADGLEGVQRVLRELLALTWYWLRGDYRAAPS